MNRLSFSKHYPFSKIIFFLFLFFLPQQFGPHFWPYFSYVHGIRLDYLSPALYISTVLLLTLVLLKGKAIIYINKDFLTSTKVLVFFTCLLFPLLYAYSIQALYFGILKMCVFIFLGLYIKTEIKQKKDLPVTIGILGISSLFESILSIAQFTNQGSLNGIFYFFGERYYTASSLSIAAMNTATGLIVRPYGTFPHPNVLAYFLFVTSVCMTYVITQGYKKWIKACTVFILIISQIALFLTFSRILIFCNALFFLYILLQTKTKYKLHVLFGVGGAAILLFTVYLSAFNLRFLNFSNMWADITVRNELVPIALSAVKGFPLGLGLYNFYYYEAGIQTHFSSVYLQPVHNIFLLLLAESGIVCTILFVYFLGLTLVKLFKRSKQHRGFTISKGLFALLVVSLSAGLFDHYLITIQQGQLLFALILGLSWNRNIR